MAKRYRLSCLFLLLILTSKLQSQPFVNITVPSQMILKGQPFEATVEARNMPANGMLQVMFNGYREMVMLKDSTATISVVDTVIGDYEAVIDARIIVAKKTVLRESRKLYYTIFPLVYALELGPSNILYRGVENQFNLAVAGIAPQNIMLSITGGATIRKTSTAFAVTTYSRDSIVALTIAANMGGKIVMLARKIYHLADRPAVVCSIDRKVSDISPADTAIRVRANLPGALQRIAPPAVLSFSCRMWTGGAWTSYRFSGNTIRGELVNKIRDMRQGDLLFVEEISIQWPGSNDGMFADPFAIAPGQ